MSEGWWVLGGVIVGAISSGAINLMLQGRQFTHEKNMHKLKNQGAENVKSLLQEMLSHKGYTDRSFDAIRNKVGGFSDDEIRQLLHEVEAKKVIRANDKKEYWYLAAREAERIEGRANKNS